MVCWDPDVFADCVFMNDSKPFIRSGYFEGRGYASTCQPCRPDEDSSLKLVDLLPFPDKHNNGTSWPLTPTNKNGDRWISRETLSRYMHCLSLLDVER